ncbi:MAG TPA: hypothetical protein VGE74_26640 [Gemmata sp.]
MQIDARFGSDTGMCLVDVLVETPEELSYTDEQIEAGAWALLAEQRISRRDVVDLSIRIQNGSGAWVPATRDADGKLVPVPW